MTERRTSTKLYQTGLALAWIWAVGWFAVGIGETTWHARVAGPNETYFIDGRGNVSVLDKDFASPQGWSSEERAALKALSDAVGGLRPASKEEIQEYLAKPQSFDTV